MLLQDAGILIETVDSSYGAYELINNSEDVFDLVLVDYNLKYANGPEVIKKIQQIKPEQKVAILSGDPSREALKESLKAGAIDFLEKGSDTVSLIKKLKRLISNIGKGIAPTDESNQNQDQDLDLILNKIKNEFNEREVVVLVNQNNTKMNLDIENTTYQKFKETLFEKERRFIKEAIKSCKSAKEAASKLGVPYNTFRYMLKRFKLCRLFENR